MVSCQVVSDYIGVWKNTFMLFDYNAGITVLLFSVIIVDLLANF